MPEKEIVAEKVSMASGDGLRAVGYRDLLHTNRNFRTLWYGQIVSELGDWLNTVALLNLMLELTGKARVIGWFFIIIHLPAFFVGPVAGVLADRFDRKKLMIAMDLVRAVLVLGYFAVRSADQIWILYIIAALEVSLATVFEPARNAIIPDICRIRELLSANALGSITWSTVLAVGAAAGGLITAKFGRHACYLVDSVSFLGSALLIARIRTPKRVAEGQESTRSFAAGFRDMFRGFGYLRASPRVLALVLVKTGWALGAGVLILISVFGEMIFPVGGSGAAGIGVLYTARGIGAALGPIIARRFVKETSRAMRNAITAGFLTSSIAYMVFGNAPILPLAALALSIAHMGSSTNWVFSTVLLQMEVPAEYRGRVFATEFALMTLGIAVSSYVAGYWLDVAAFSPRLVATLLGAYFAIPALLWLSARPLFRQY
jgi:MFS family permease